MVNIISLNGKTYEISNYKNDVLFKEWKGYLVLREIPQPPTPQTQNREVFSSTGEQATRNADKTGESHNQEEKRIFRKEVFDLFDGRKAKEEEWPKVFESTGLRFEVDKDGDIRIYDISDGYPEDFPRLPIIHESFNALKSAVECAEKLRGEKDG